MNICTMFGRLTKDPTLKTVNVNDANGNAVPTPVCDVWMYVDSNFGPSKTSDLIKVTAWRGAAKAIAENMKKGRQMAVSGNGHPKAFMGADGKIVAYLHFSRVDYFEFGDRRIIAGDEVPEVVVDDCPFDAE